MGRFYDVDGYVSSSGGFLEIIVPLLMFAYAFIFWGGAARLRLTVFVLVWFGLMAYGASLGGAFGVILLIAALWIAIFLMEPVSSFIENEWLRGPKQDAKLAESDVSQVSSNKSTAANKESKKLQPAINCENNKTITKSLDPVSAYELGFEDRMQSKQMRLLQGKNLKIIKSYELGYDDASCYINDLLNIKEKASSELDLFLTLLHALETNLAPTHILETLVVVFDEAVQMNRSDIDTESDSTQKDEITFVISKIENLLSK